MKGFFALALCLYSPVVAVGAQSMTILSREDVAGIPQLRKEISVSFVGVSIETALREIGRKAGLPITYNDRILPGERTVWLTRSEIRTDAALEEVLRGSGLRLVALTSGQVVVVKATEPEQQQGTRIQPDTIRGTVTTSPRTDPRVLHEHSIRQPGKADNGPAPWPSPTSGPRRTTCRLCLARVSSTTRFQTGRSLIRQLPRRSASLTMPLLPAGT